MKEYSSADYQLAELIFMEIEGTIEAFQFDILQEKLRNDPDALRCYVELTGLYSALSNPGEIAYSKDMDVAGYDALLQVLAEDEKTAYEITVEESIEKPAELGLRLVQVEKPRRRVSKFSLYSLIFSTAAMILFIVMVMFTPERPIVATLTDSFNAEWIGTEEMPIDRAVLRTGRFILRKGLAEITFDNGAVVIVKGPTEFMLEAMDQIYIKEGNLFANIQSAGGGFVVRTPRASVVDYGTEFGVMVDDFGQTETHVFKGLVDLRTGSNPRVFHDSQKLAAGQAGLVDQSGQLSSGTFRADMNLFTRETPSPYEVAVRKSNPLAYWRFSRDQKTFSNLMNESEYRGRYFEPVRFEESGPDLGDGKTCPVMKLEDNGGYAAIEDIVPQDTRTGSSSLAAWVRLDTRGGQSIVCASTAVGPAREHSLQFRTNDDGEFEFYVFTKAAERNVIKSKTQLELGRWYHLTGVVDRTKMNFYIDGKLVGISNMDALQIRYTHTSQLGYNHLNIGGWAGIEDPVHTRKGLNGAVAEISLHRRALSLQEIKAIYRAAKSRE